MASPSSSSSVPSGIHAGPPGGMHAGPGMQQAPPPPTSSAEATTQEVIYKLLLAKLMEVQSSSLQQPLPPAAPAAAAPPPDSNGLHHHSNHMGGGLGSLGGASSFLSHFGSGMNGLSPPSSTSAFAPPATTAAAAAAAGGYGTASGLPTTPTKEGSRIGMKRASPYAESHTPPAAPPHPAAASAAAMLGALPSAASPTGAAAAAVDGCNSLPNFLLVKITDLRSVERLQNLLARNGFTETRLVLATGETPTSLMGTSMTSSVGGGGGGALGGNSASYDDDDAMMDMDQDPILNAHHHQLQLQHLQQQQQGGGSLLHGSSSGSCDSSRRDSMLLSQRLQHVPDVAATEEVADEEYEDENVEVVDESMPLTLPSSSIPSGTTSNSLSSSSALPLVASSTAAAAAAAAAPFAQLSPPVNANEPPTDIQVAEVRHRSVSRSDGVDNEDVYVKCRLCENRIMNTRLSNLTNHVRRHAKLKQFQCAHCSYEHNEIFKVRTHMSRAHGDAVSAPLDRRSPEMERQWEALMHACFPRNPLLHPQNGLAGTKESGIHTSASFSHPSSSSSNGESSSSGGATSSLFSSRATFSPGSNSAASKAAQHAARGRYSPAHTASPPGSFTCSSCKESIPEESLQAHMREEHVALLSAMHFYICRECGYKSSHKDRVRQHAGNTHDVVDIMQIPVESRPSLALQKLFPEKRVVTNEECYVLGGADGSQPHDHHRVDDEDEDMDGLTAAAAQKFCCRMCSRTLNSSAGAVTHAKKHYPTRQFHCTLCLYQAVDEAKVRAHLLTKHMSIDLPINVVDGPMQRGWMDTLESCFPELANSTGAALIGTIADDIGEDCESDTKRRKLERAAAAAAAVAASDAAGVLTQERRSDRAISPSTTCHIVRATEAEEEEEIDVV